VTFEQRGDGSYGRSTFIALFEPNTVFPEHTHSFGEEVYVVEGTLSDEFCDYPKGTYIRQAINSSHTPFSKQGCKLFVKMWQMPLNSSEKVLVDINPTSNYQQLS
jgi:anti-sigma factor ChrR (cupin superfamily)